MRSLPVGKHCDGRGLWLYKRADGGAQWLFRFNLWGRQRGMGLGPLSKVGLAQARQAADVARKQVHDGVDPISARRLERQQSDRKEGRLEYLAEAAFAAHRKQLKHNGDNGRWYSPLRLHVLPKLGKMPIVKINQQDIKTALAPIWHEKNETARKALSRLTTVFEYAVADGFIVDMNAISNARILLGKNDKAVKRIESMKWQDVPSFYATLDNHDPTQLALRMLILTGVRSDSINNMQFEQIKGRTWEIPPQFVKGRITSTAGFRVPLCQEALHIIELANKIGKNGFLFPNARGRGLDKMAMRNFLVSKNIAARPHGFRSSLRTWLSEETDCAHEVAEACIGHFKHDEVENAYNRTDYLMKRATHMRIWSNHVTGRSEQIVNAA
ncbi:integrase arm-type DNA-binding domain-containing protein [Rhodobacteraceae bacterium KMM 6894]|nr:integrase arm-type DNA-binding domain-containing protein [Rhodobacteraceae bacterium KMM 6894]